MSDSTILPRCVDCGALCGDKNSKRCRSCYDASRRKAATEKNPNYKKHSHCIDCGAELKREDATRCAACYAKRRTGKNNPNYKGSEICPECGGRKARQAKKCLNCQKALYKGLPICANCGKPLSRHRGLTSGYCQECYKGELSKRWNSELTPEQRLEGRAINPEYREWRDTVFHRDDFQCQKCGDKRGGNLVAHHIFSFKDNPDLRLVVSNGITLCEPCHRAFHKHHGATHNTRSQLDDFLKS